LRLEAELEGQLAAKVGAVDQGVVQIEGAHLVGVQLIAQPSEGRGLAAAGLAGEDAQGLGVDQVAQARVQLFERRRTKQLIAREGALEGQMGEAEEGFVDHDSPSPR